MTRLAVCVDDYGAAPGIADAVERLAARGRVQAVSCIVAAPGWRRDAARLAALAPQVEAGLHVALSETAPLSAALRKAWPHAPTLRALILRAHARALPRDGLRAELETQVGAFTDAYGAPPRFVDGHQHVHHLPVVRDVLFQVLERAGLRPAIRNTGRITGPGDALKRAAIAGTGGRALAARLARDAWQTNPALTGVYDFRAPDYGARMRAWLAALPGEGALLFCHPSTQAGIAPGDTIAPARVRELSYLESDAFARDLQAARVALGPVWQPLTGTTTRG